MQLQTKVSARTTLSVAVPYTDLM